MGRGEVSFLSSFWSLSLSTVSTPPGNTLLSAVQGAHPVFPPEPEKLETSISSFAEFAHS